MKTFLTITAALLLLFNAIGALFGGWNLITHPDGSSLQMSLDFLKKTPFHTYLIPGIILFVANGLFSIFVLLALVFRFWYASWLNNSC
jgi:ABC-type proline/glycine betaine transport system permease subunit